MGNHIAETRSAAGMSKTTLCYTGVSKERENEKILIKNYEKHQKGTLKPYESIVFYQKSRA